MQNEGSPTPRRRNIEWYPARQSHPSENVYAACRRPSDQRKEPLVSLGTILLIILILMLVGVLPTWPHSRSWGYAPSGGLGLVLVIVLILFLLGRI
jgi:hypothetical protein